LKIKAGKEAHPVLLVELKDRKPFLTTGPGTSLVLDGLTIIARYTDQAAVKGGAGADPGPIIEAAGPALLRYCALEVENKSDRRGARALVSNGGALTVENCWFEGFETALEVHCIGGSAPTVRQTMMISKQMNPVSSSSVPSESIPFASESSGWGLRVKFLGGGPAGSARRLILDHCTVTGAGVLQLAGFSQGFPLQVETRNCAVQTEALLAWEPTAPNIPLSRQTLRWSGEANQLDVASQSWIETSSKMTSPLSVRVTDLDSWLQVAQEHDLILGRLEFLANPSTRAGSPQPRDFVIKSAGPRKPGADPEQVGPQATRSRGPLP
jgi:hypothetical protein